MYYLASDVSRPTTRSPVSNRRRPTVPADPPQRPGQSDVADGVRELRPPRRLQIGQQVELAAVVGPVMWSA
jgi:hypothetical protein